MRVVLWMLGAYFALQVLTIVTLQGLALLRKARKPLHGFPVPNLPEARVGENTLRIFSQGQALFDAMLADIDAATETIYLESFILKGDAFGRELRKHLEVKAAQGIAVYVIFDAFGNLLVRPSFKRFPKRIHLFRYRGVRKLRHVVDPRRYVVDHRKLLVIDGVIGFTGGFNLGSRYATDWRDTHMRVQGPAAADLAQSFAEFWNRQGPRDDQIARRYPRTFDARISLWSTDALRLTFPIRAMYIRAIDRAERSILLTNAYFVPDRHLMGALRAAAKRGVEVRVLVPWISNHILVDWMARAYFSFCLGCGIRVYGYRRAMIHAKTCTVDGQWSTIGTANLDRLSSVGNYELNVEIYSAEVAAQMRTLFECDMQSSIEVLPEAWAARPWIAKLGERLVSPLRLFV
jgi:cardiolipin synthase A/B